MYYWEKDGTIMKEIMRLYSTTFYNCMEDWPEDIKKDIYKLYAYLRVCDEEAEGLRGLETMKSHTYEQFKLISDKYNFDNQWIEDFHKSMKIDKIQKKHTTVSMIEYCKGSAESVGLMMARILGAPPEADAFAKALGRAYQIINFVRDYDDDVSRGYHYIGEEHDMYLRIFREELSYAVNGLHYIKPELRKPILKANKMYEEIANER